MNPTDEEEKLYGDFILIKRAGKNIMAAWLFNGDTNELTIKTSDKSPITDRAFDKLMHHFAYTLPYIRAGVELPLDERDDNEPFAAYTEVD